MQVGLSLPRKKGLGHNATVGVGALSCRSVLTAGGRQSLLNYSQAIKAGASKTTTSASCSGTNRLKAFGANSILCEPTEITDCTSFNSARASG